MHLFVRSFVRSFAYLFGRRRFWWWALIGWFFVLFLCAFRSPLRARGAHLLWFARFASLHASLLRSNSADFEGDQGDDYRSGEESDGDF